MLKTAWTLYALLLVGGAAFAGPAVSVAPMEMDGEDLKTRLGLGPDHRLQPSRLPLWARQVQRRGEGGLRRLDQYFKGVRVWGGEVKIQSGGDLRLTSQRVYPDIAIPTEPTLLESEVRALVLEDLADRGLGNALSLSKACLNGERSLDSASVRLLAEPSLECVILPIEEQRIKVEASHKAWEQLNAEDVYYAVKEYRLVYHVQTEGEDAAGRHIQMRYFVDAQRGEILRKWDGVRRAAAMGTANTKYSGKVSIQTNGFPGDYAAMDPVSKCYVVDEKGSLYIDADNTWGNGGNYADGTVEARQTGSAEILYSIQRACQMHKHVYGRDGHMGDGSGLKIFWGKDAASDTSYVNGPTGEFMTIGYADSKFNDMCAIDVVAHEYGHAIDSWCAGLILSMDSEGGGMSEANGDIQGVLARAYAKFTPFDPEKPATAIPEEALQDPAMWVTGEKVVKETVNGGKALRFFIRPSDDKEAGGIDAWRPEMVSMDIHGAAGPINRMFYYLTVGAPSDPAHPGYSSYLKKGSKGIGLHKAGMIWMKTLLRGDLGMTSKCMDARSACLETAKELYGEAEIAAVEDAFAGVNVGQPHAGGTSNTEPGTDQPGEAKVVITPGFITLKPHQKFQFKANVKVSWKLWEGRKGGSIYTDGTYFAPSRPGLYRLLATSKKDANNKALVVIQVKRK